MFGLGFIDQLIHCFVKIFNGMIFGVGLFIERAIRLVAETIHSLGNITHLHIAAFLDFPGRIFIYEV